MGGGSSKNAKHDGDHTVPPSRGSAPPSRAASAGPGKLKAAAKGSNRDVKSAKRSQSEKIIGSGDKSPPKPHPKVTPANSKRNMVDYSGGSHYPTRLTINVNEAKELKDPTGKRSEKEKGSVYCVISVGATVRVVESIPEQKLANCKFASQNLMFPFSRTVAVGTDELFCTVYIHVYAFTAGAPDTYLGECQVQLGEHALLSGKSPVQWHDLTAQDGTPGSGRVLVSVQPHLEKREQTQQEVDEAIARMLEEEEARGKGGGGGGGGKGKRLSKISDEGGDELIAKMLQEEEEKAMREQQKRLAGGRPVAVH